MRLSFGCWLIFLTSFNSGIALANDSFTLQDSFKLRQLVRAKMAPDGNHVAFSVTVPRRIGIDADGGNLQELYLVNRKGQTRVFVSDRNSLGQIEWSADSKHIWFLSDLAEDRVWDLYRIAESGGSYQRVLSHSEHIQGFSISDDNRYLIYWAKPANKQKAALLQQGFSSQVYQEDTPTNKLWLVDLNALDRGAKIIFTQHVLSARFVPDSKKIALKYAATANVEDRVLNSQLAIIDIQGNSLNQFEHAGKMGKFAVSPDAGHIALIGTNDLHNPSAGQLFLGKIGHPGIQKRLAGLQAQIEDLVWLSDTKLALLVHQGTDSFIATHSINAGETDDYRIISKNIGIATSLHASANGRDLAMLVSAPDHPKELFWHRKGESYRVTDSNTWLKQRKLAKQRVIEFKARDGLELEGVLVEPERSFKKPWPMILYVHGGPEAHVSNGWLDRYTRPVQYAASLGFATFLPNYRGSTARGIAFTQLGQRDYAGAEFNDLVDAKQHLVEKGWVDANRVGITGASYGGYASAWAATAQSEHFRAAVATMGIGNQVSKFGTTDIPNEMYLQHARQWPWQDWHWLLSRSPVFHANANKTPILLMHGKKDPRVHYSQSMELHRYLSLQGAAPARLVLFPHEGHGFKRSAARYEYAARLMRWMQHFVLENNQSMPPYTVESILPAED